MSETQKAVAECANVNYSDGRDTKSFGRDIQVNLGVVGKHMKELDQKNWDWTNFLASKTDTAAFQKALDGHIGELRQGVQADAFTACSEIANFTKKAAGIQTPKDAARFTAENIPKNAAPSQATEVGGLFGNAKIAMNAHHKAIEDASK